MLYTLDNMGKKTNLAKYFWDLNAEELAQTRQVMQDPAHPRFPQRMVALLSRCDRPQELFSVIPKTTFIAAWPKIRSYWLKHTRVSHPRDWWETLYEQMTRPNERIPDRPSEAFRRLGIIFKERRMELGLSQKQLALQARIHQPAISQIEDGQKNITLFTLLCICKVLGLKNLKIEQ